LEPAAVDVAEQLCLVETYLLWAERLDKGDHPWLWEIPSDKTDLVTELSKKYLEEVCNDNLKR
jgi:hypothetical protein